MRAVLPLLTAALLTLAAPAAATEACGGTHVVQNDETLRDIAVRYYGDARKWSALYYANAAELEGQLGDLQPGTELQIQCLDTANGPEATTPLQDPDAELRMLTGGNYPPFTDQDLPNKGLITEIVNAAMEAAPYPVSFAIDWNDAWSEHLFPLLDEHRYDMGFPWLQPNCPNPKNERCRNFHFSDPLFEMLILLFARADNPIPFAKDADIIGKTLCRPAGYYTHDLDRADRQWITKNLVTLRTPETPDACFDLLMQGEVDAVALNEFLGRSKIHELGLDQDVVALDRPVSIEGLHLVISKTHPRGTTHRYRFNAGMAKLKDSQRFQEIVGRHLSRFWDSVE